MEEGRWEEGRKTHTRELGMMERVGGRMGVGGSGYGQGGRWNGGK